MKEKLINEIDKYIGEAKKSPWDIKADAIARLERLADRANVDFDDITYEEFPRYKKEVDNFVSKLKKAVDKAESSIRDALGRLH